MAGRKDSGLWGVGSWEECQDLPIPPFLFNIAFRTCLFHIKMISKYFAGVLCLLLLSCHKKQEEDFQYLLIARGPLPHDTIHIDNTQQNLSIRLPDNIGTVKYFLSNVDATPLVSHTNLIRYTNLAGGEYILEITKSDSSKTQIVIRKDSSIFYSNWFTPFIFINIFIVFILVFIVWLLYDRRQKQKVQDIRNKLVRELHDDTAGSLSTLTSLAKFKRKQALKTGKLEIKDIDQVIENCEKISYNFRDGIHILDPKHQTCYFLISRMQKHSIDTLQEQGIEVEWTGMEENFVKRILEMHITLNQYWNIFFIFKEIINNITKHSQATEVAIVCAVSGYEIKIRVQDNGIGYDTSAQHTGYGLQNLIKRSKEANADIIFQSIIGQGTTVTFGIPPL